MTAFLASNEGFDFTPLFEFDAHLSEEQTASVRWTEYPVESGAVLSDFASRDARRYNLSGVVTATTEAGIDPARPSAVLEGLVALVDAREQLWLSTPNFLALVVLDSCHAKGDVQDGQMLRVDIEAHTVERTTWVYVEIPAELLADEVRAGSAKPAGTADATVEADAEAEESAGPRKSVAAKIADGDFGGIL